MARKPAPEYPPLPYHTIRFVTFTSASIVTAILLYFCYHLKHDNFKLPWTFLIVLAGTLPALASLLLTACLKSPLTALILNIPILLLWSGGLILLGWNMTGALGHTCNAANWGSSDGIMICQTYKALFAFTVIGCLSVLAGVVLDIRVRRIQNRLGAYDQMAEGKEWDVKMDTFSDNPNVNPHSPHDNSLLHGPRPTLARSPYESFDNTDQYQTNEYREERRGRFGGNGDVNMTDFRYQAPSEQTTYDSGSYGQEHGRSSFDPTPVHHGADVYANGGRY
jgi:hypothetical protein